MEIKTIQPVKVFHKTVKTNLANIHNYVGTMPAQLMEEADNLGLNVCSPQIWRYLGSDGNPETEFTLQIALPIAEPNNNIDNLAKLDAFKCAAFIHEGSWSEFGKVYERIIGDVMTARLKMSGETREVYHQVDFENEANNVTEIQIGIL
ncbi:MAG: GyrI-like domain-containing protein [Salinivirgaceae bacterium]|jgi:effector-binding domain-containing protein|nr:GyrI-like domain-containing protein [Salinivirgaceae bacterium]